MAFIANQKLIDAYEKVFDDHGETRPCGRDACIALIEECKKVAPKVYFGDSQTGMMDTKAIKLLVNRERKK